MPFLLCPEATAVLGSYFGLRTFPGEKQMGMTQTRIKCGCEQAAQMVDQTKLAAGLLQCAVGNA